MTFSNSLNRLSRFLPFEPMSIMRLLVLLFPIGIIYVRHWGSTIFGLLVLAALILWPYKKRLAPELLSQEKTLIGILLGYFIVAVMSITANGWDQAGQYALGTELRFLLIIPFYLLIRRCEDLWRYLWIGCLLGVVATTLFGLHEQLVLGQQRPNGIYGPLFLGPVLLLMIALQLPWLRQLASYRWRNAVILIIALGGLYIVFASGARSAYLALVLGMSVAVIYYLRGRNAVLSAVAAIIIVILAYQLFDIVKQRVDLAATEANNYATYLFEHPGEPNKYGDGSVGVRLEMWRAALFAAGEEPLLGVGRYNFDKKLEQYVKENRINAAATQHAHPHNVFFEALANKGMLGLIAVLALYGYPLYFFIRTRNDSRESAFAGILLIVLIGAYSLTEVAPVYFGNFTSVFLIFLSIIFAWHGHQLRTVKRAGKPQPV